MVNNGQWFLVLSDFIWGVSGLEVWDVATSRSLVEEAVLVLMETERQYYSACSCPHTGNKNKSKNEGWPECLYTLQREQ